MPSAPTGLRLQDASLPYLQSLTAYFFPAVTTQLANVHCQRSWRSSLFSAAFLNPAHRRDALEALSNWRPRFYREKISKFDRSFIAPFSAWLARFFEHHYIFFNFVSNPLIDLGILFELLLCYFFFYTPLARIYYFAPVPWHVYLFACHGTVILFAFEETKKYYRRKGYSLEFLG